MQEADYRGGMLQTEFVLREKKEILRQTRHQDRRVLVPPAILTRPPRSRMVVEGRDRNESTSSVLISTEYLSSVWGSVQTFEGQW